MSSRINKLYEFEDFVLDCHREILTQSDKIVALPPKAVELLLILIENRERVVEKEFLMQEMWSNTIVEESNLTQNIYTLRKVLDNRGDGKSLIKTYSKRGYKFLSKVRVVDLIEGEKIIDSPDSSSNFIDEIPLIFSAKAAINGTPAEAATSRRLIRETEETTAQSSKSSSVVSSEIEKKPAAFFAYHKIAAVVCAFVFLTGFIIYNRQAAAVEPPRQPVRGIAVLPFNTIGSDKDDEFLGLGMADAIITRLGGTDKIKISPTEAVRRYDDAKQDPLAVGRELNVETVLTGNIQRSDSRVRVTVQLLRVSDNSLLWTDRFDENFTDIFSVQDTISQRLAGELTSQLSETDRKQLTAKYTPSIEAYQLYLKGRFYWSKRAPEWIQKAIPCFEEAIRLDPQYASAYAGLADAYAVTASGLPSAERFPKAKAAALRALELDETLAEAHTSLAFILYKNEWNWAESEKHSRRAIELNPAYALAHHWFGEFLGLRGNFDEGISELAKAAELDPLSLAIKTDTARIYYRARRYDEAVKFAQQTLELDPNYRNAWTTLVYAYGEKRMYEKAAAADLQTLRIANITPPVLETLKQTFELKGWQSYWQKRLELMNQSSQFGYITSYEYAEDYIRLGEKETALKYLKKSVAEREDGFLYIKVEPLLDPLRSESEFAELYR